jgi:hypothetical protein
VALHAEYVRWLLQKPPVRREILRATRTVQLVYRHYLVVAVPQGSRAMAVFFASEGEVRVVGGTDLQVLDLHGHV